MGGKSQLRQLISGRKMERNYMDRLLKSILRMERFAHTISPNGKFDL
jgi:hypothetical protein